MDASRADVVVVGGGIAGVSAAYHLAEEASVILVEAESQLAAHSTGRSAAVFFENYGAFPNRPLTKASRAFFTDRADQDGPPLVTPRGALWVGDADQIYALDAVAADARRTGTTAHEISGEEAAEKAPMLDIAAVARAVWEPDPLDIDVAAAHQHFVGGFRARGGEIRTVGRVTDIGPEGTSWRVTGADFTVDADAVVNAAGAWGDEVAAMAGVSPVGLTPMRRTAFTVAGDEAWARCPMVIDVDQRFYFKPDGSQLLCSPADETPTAPMDPRPDPADVALAIERINAATHLGIRSVRAEWAGLRTFTDDRAMVIGPDPQNPGFVWLVGQGGTGIQTAPAAAELVASLVLEQPLPTHLAACGVDPELLAPDRLRACPSR